jgi:uncharacterized membrane protein YdjX (TVP38/TMEM64 family)
MEKYELYKSDNQRVVIYKSPIELLRFSVLMIYIICPIYLAYALYQDGELDKVFPIIILIVLSLICLLGAALMLLEEYDFTNNMWIHNYIKVSFPASFIFFLLIMIRLFPPLSVTLSLFDEWFGWLNIISSAGVFVFVSAISYWTQTVTAQQSRNEMLSKSTVFGTITIVLIWLIAFSVSLLPLSASGILSLLVCYLLSNYPEK